MNDIDVCDGKYTGEMTIAQTIEQYKYRAGIHQSYINMLEEYPNAGYEAYGTEEWHWWAINGYEEGIRHLESKVVRRVKIKCTLGEAFLTIIKFIGGLFGRSK